MTIDQNKEVVRKALNSIQTGNTKELDQITADNWVNHDPSLPPMQGKEGARQLASLFHNAFPDARMQVGDLIGEGDRVGGRFTFTGTHTGKFLDMPPTGKKVNVEGFGIFRVVAGKLTDNWVNFDAFGLMRQLGVVPEPGQKM